MYAVVEIQGSQFKVEKNQKLFVNRIDAKEGSKVSFDNVLLVDDGKKVQVGKPNLSGTSVEAKVVAHKKDDKVIVFKKKRRKGYKVKNGHRQAITEIIIQGISEKKASPKKEVETIDKKPEEPLADGEVNLEEGQSLADMKAKLKPKKPKIDLSMLDTSSSYDDKVVLMRLLVSEDSSKVAQVFKKMIKFIKYNYE